MPTKPLNRAQRRAIEVKKSNAKVAASKPAPKGHNNPPADTHNYAADAARYFHSGDKWIQEGERATRTGNQYLAASILAAHIHLVNAKKAPPMLHVCCKAAGTDVFEMKARTQHIELMVEALSLNPVSAPKKGAPEAEWNAYYAWNAKRTMLAEAYDVVYDLSSSAGTGARLIDPAIVLGWFNADDGMFYVPWNVLVPHNTKPAQSFGDAVAKDVNHRVPLNGKGLRVEKTGEGTDKYEQYTIKASVTQVGKSRRDLRALAEQKEASMRTRATPVTSTADASTTTGATSTTAPSGSASTTTAAGTSTPSGASASTSTATGSQAGQTQATGAQGASTPSGGTIAGNKLPGDGELSLRQYLEGAVNILKADKTYEPWEQLDPRERNAYGFIAAYAIRCIREQVAIDATFKDTVAKAGGVVQTLLLGWEKMHRAASRKQAEPPVIEAKAIEAAPITTAKATATRKAPRKAA